MHQQSSTKKRPAGPARFHGNPSQNRSGGPGLPDSGKAAAPIGRVSSRAYGATWSFDEVSLVIRANGVTSALPQARALEHLEVMLILWSRLPATDLQDRALGPFARRSTSTWQPPS